GLDRAESAPRDRPRVDVPRVGRDDRLGRRPAAPRLPLAQKALHHRGQSAGILGIERAGDGGGTNGSHDRSNVSPGAENSQAAEGGPSGILIGLFSRKDPAMPIRRLLLPLLLVLVALTPPAGAQDKANAAVEVRLTEYAVEMPKTLLSGPTTFQI